MNILTEAFSRDHNPDGADLERIAAEAGLMKRVTQVWFQNARARKKKSERSTGGGTSSAGAGQEVARRNTGSSSSSGGGAGARSSNGLGLSSPAVSLAQGPTLMPASAPSISPDSCGTTPPFEGNVGSVTPPEFHAVPVTGQAGMSAPGPFQTAYAPEFVFRGETEA